MPSFSPLVLVFSTLIAASPQSISGVVVDSSDRPVPRAIVQIVASDGTTAASAFTEADGSFRFASAPDSCRVHVALAGFEPADADCAPATPMRLSLRVAPVAEHIVVSATRTEAPAAQVGSSLDVFDAADIDRLQQPLLADLLRESTGVAVVRTGAPGGVTSLFVRGGESNYTKILLDGIPLNEPGGAFDLSNVTTENLDRVEFVRGANSALYGSDAMTGVIQLFTRRARGARPQILFRAEGGSFSTEGGSFRSTARASADLSGRTGRFDYALGAEGLTTDNEVPNDEFRNATVSGSGGAELGSGASLRFVGRIERGRSGTPGQTAFGRPDLDAFFSRHDAVWGATFNQTRHSIHQRASYGLSASNQASTNLHIDPPYTPTFDGRSAPFEFMDFAYDSRTDLRRHHAGYQIDRTSAPAHAGTHVDTALVDWDGERATLRDALAGTADAASRDNVGLSLQHQALWTRLSLTGGVRIEHNASFGSAVVPRVAASVLLGSRTWLHANAGRGIKEPTVLQSFSTNPFFLGNPALRPERTNAVEAGIEQRLARDRVRLDATWFSNRYRDIISTRTLSFDPYRSQYFNVGLTRARGAELSGDLALVSGLRAKAGYTFVDSEILETTSEFDPVFQAGNQAFRRPRHSGFADVAWNRGRASLDVSGTFVGKRVDSDFSSLEPPIAFNTRYAQWDVRAAWAIARGISLTAAVDNAGDSRHMEPLGYPVLGRAFRGGVRIGY